MAGVLLLTSNEKEVAVVEYGLTVEQRGVFKSVTRMSRERYESVTRMLQECYNSATRVLQECNKSFTRVLRELEGGRGGGIRTHGRAAHMIEVFCVKIVQCGGVLVLGHTCASIHEREAHTGTRRLSRCS
jgi:hypothetical protein